MTRNIRLLYCFQFLKSLQLFGAVIVPFYLERGRLDYTRMFLLEGSFSLFVFLLEVPTGTVADRLGRKASLLVGTLLGGGSFVLFGLVRSYPLFFVANLLCAAGTACISGADQALLYDSLVAAGKAEESRKLLARYQAVGTTAMLVGFPVGAGLAGLSWLPRERALASVFVLFGAILLTALIPLLLIDEPPRERPPQGAVRQGLDGLVMLLRPGRLRAFTLDYALISATTFFMFWFYQSLAREAAVPLQWNGFLGAGLNLLGMILLWNAARLERAVGLARLLVGSALLAGISYLALVALPRSGVAFLPAFVIVGMKLMRGPLLSDLINKQVDSQLRATVLSGVSMLERAAIFLLYPVVGLLADRSLSTAFAALGVATLGFAALSRPPRRGRD